MTVRVYTGAALTRYGFGATHPFGNDRHDPFWHEAAKQGLDLRVSLGTPVACADADLLRFHTADYLAFAKRRSDLGGGYLDAATRRSFPESIPPPRPWSGPR